MTPDQAPPPREPTEAMLEVGCRLNGELMCRHIWHAMYDAWANSSTPAASDAATPGVREAHPQSHATAGTDDAGLIAKFRAYGKQSIDPGVTASRLFISIPQFECAQVAARLAAQAARIAELELDCARLNKRRGEWFDPYREAESRAERLERDPGDHTDVCSIHDTVNPHCNCAGSAGTDDSELIANIANEMGRLFRQRHNQADMRCLLLIVYRAGLRAGINAVYRKRALAGNNPPK